MKTKVAFLLGVIVMANTHAATSFYEMSAPGIDGKPQSLSQYKGKAVLVVNTASQCGYTPQYQGLEALYQKYKDKGLVVVGFPSNDFGAQEPGSNAEIKKFCDLKFRVSFPLYSKDKVKGDGKQPVYKFLTEESDPKFRGEVAWNFEKFLVDKSGKVVGRYKSAVTPDSKELVSAVEATLK